MGYGMIKDGTRYVKESIYFGACDRIESLEKRIAKLEAALKPFVVVADCLAAFPFADPESLSIWSKTSTHEESVTITYGDLYRAKEALNAKPD